MNRDDINRQDGEEQNLPTGTGSGEHDAATEKALTEWESQMLRVLNGEVDVPERTRPSVVLPRPPYFDRTITDRWRFMERAKPKITKDVLKQIIRGKGGVMNEIFRGRSTPRLAHTLLTNAMFRDVEVARDMHDIVYVPSKVLDPGFLAGGDIEVPIGVDEPSWWPGRDKAGGGGNGNEAGEDDADIVYLPITYEEFLEMLALLFDLPFLKQTDMDKMLVYTIKMRGLKKTGPTVRMDKRATAVARLERFRITYNSRPEDFPNLTADSNPTVDLFPFHKTDLRYKRIEERWDPDSKAVVFFELDTSGSMAGEPLAIAKFFFLLNLMWLRSKYNEVKVVYIAHNHRAERVRNEADFFRTDINGGTGFAPAHELVWDIMNAEFPGDGWNKYCLHATDGFGEHESQITPWIEKLIRGGFNYFGYCEVDIGWGGWGETSGMRAVKQTAPDVREHCGWARIATLDEVPEAMRQIMTKDKTA